MGLDTTWQASVWHQFGAAIDMLENAVVACPDDLWGDRLRRPEYWRLVYHSLFFLDYYLSPSPDGFAPPPPFTLDELDPAAPEPDAPYTKAQLLSYVDHGRRKCHAAITSLTDEESRRLRRFGSIEGGAIEVLLYNMRHVQHHVAQLNLILRQTIDRAPAWVARAGATRRD